MLVYTFSYFRAADAYIQAAKCSIVLTGSRPRLREHICIFSEVLSERKIINDKCKSTFLKQEI